MSLGNLLAWNSLAGEYYGSEDQSIFFYSYCKMQRPETVLELGTGLGHTALWMAQAMKENGSGHVWTVDNSVRWPQAVRYLASRTAEVRNSSPMFWEVFNPDVLAIALSHDTGHSQSHVEFMERLADALGLSTFVSFLRGTLSLTDTAAVTAESQGFLAPALERSIDILYADFDHYPHAILSVLTKYLPLMSKSASIFVDSASTYLASHLTIEQTIDQLNHGKLPAIFLAGTTRSQREQLAEIALTRRFSYVPLPEKKDRNQNGLAWIRIEPVNVVPYPLTQLRGLFAGPTSGQALESLFETGALPEEEVKKSFLFEQFVRAAYPLSEGELRFLLALMAGRNPEPGGG